MSKRSRSYLGFVSLLFLFAGFILFRIDSAGADDWIWKFNVPVEVKNMSEGVHELTLELYIFTTSKPPEDDNAAIASRSKTKKLDPGGNFLETVPIVVDHEDMKKVSWKKAKSYRVRAYFPYSQGWRASAQPGTKPVMVVEGPIAGLDMFKVIPGKKK